MLNIIITITLSITNFCTDDRIGLRISLPAISLADLHILQIFLKYRFHGTVLLKSLSGWPF